MMECIPAELITKIVVEYQVDYRDMCSRQTLGIGFVIRKEGRKKNSPGQGRTIPLPDGAPGQFFNFLKFKGARVKNKSIF